MVCVIWIDAHGSDAEDFTGNERVRMRRDSAAGTLAARGFCKSGGAAIQFSDPDRRKDRGGLSAGLPEPGSGDDHALRKSRGKSSEDRLSIRAVVERKGGSVCRFYFDAHARKRSLAREHYIGTARQGCVSG